MIGAIAGDIIGSVYEYSNVKSLDFPLFSNRSRFTDDTVLTVALADSILNRKDLLKNLKDYYCYYPSKGYGFGFINWATSSSTKPYNSFGNGSAMRVSPVGFAYNSLEKVLLESKKSAEVTHNHPEGIKGAQATATAVYLARIGKSKEEIKKYIKETFGYNLDEPIDEIRKYYKYNETCQGSVPQSIRAFLESNDYEDAIRKAISIGGDSDTIACITGGIAHAFYKEIPTEIKRKVFEILDDRLKKIVYEFTNKYSCE